MCLTTLCISESPFILSCKILPLICNMLHMLYYLFHFPFILDNKDPKFKDWFSLDIMVWQTACLHRPNHKKLPGNINIVFILSWKSLIIEQFISNQKYVSFNEDVLTFCLNEWTDGYMCYRERSLLHCSITTPEEIVSYIQNAITPPLNTPHKNNQVEDNLVKHQLSLLLPALTP